MSEPEQEEMIDSMENANSETENAKSHGEILRQQIAEGQETFHKTPSSLWLSSFSAGLEIGFSYLLICVLYTFLDG